MSDQLLRPSPTITTRLATMDDIPFMDGLMKQHNKQLGFFPTAQLQGYVEGGWVLIAEMEGTESEDGGSRMVDGQREPSSSPSSILHSPSSSSRIRVGFCASRDRYLKRDELGVIYLLCVVPGVQRKLIGASLIKAVFERSAYGCRLYCCWCAQDIAANYFWESLGFVPVAFRAGSSGKKRVHIFWQRRINDGDATTPYWYPFQTNQGAIRQDRLVFPIPPGVRWQDVQASAMPSAECRVPNGEQKKLPREKSSARQSPLATRQSPAKVAIFLGGKIRYVDRPQVGGYVAPLPERAKKPVVKREKPAAPKFDPAYVAAARELRDRWLEQVNNANHPVLKATGKYDVTRLITAGIAAPVKRLTAA